MKFFEGLSSFIFDLWKREFRAGLRGRLAYLLLRPGVERIRTLFDYELLGGSPLLGVRGTVIITHGRARRRMITYAIAVGAAAARAGVPELIAEALRPAQAPAVSKVDGPEPPDPGRGAPEEPALAARRWPSATPSCAR
jgi:fatty acid/phospholipid biosynthesis enzyme